MNIKELKKEIESKSYKSDSRSLNRVVDLVDIIDVIDGLASNTDIISSVSVIELITERRQYVINEIWGCQESDLTELETKEVNDKIERDISVLHWIHSR